MTFTLLLFGYIYYYQHIYLEGRLKHIKSLYSPNWLLGHAKWLHDLTPSHEFHRGVTKICYENREHKLLRVHVFWRPFILINDRELLKELLMAPNVSKSLFYDKFSLLFGKGIITSNGDLWSRHRIIFNKVFSPTFIKRFIGNFCYHSKRFVNWQNKFIGMEKKYPAETSKFTIDVICDTNLDYQLNEVERVSDSIICTSLQYMLGLGQNVLFTFGPDWISMLFARKSKPIVDKLVYESIQSMKGKISRDEHDENHGLLLRLALTAKDENGIGLTDKEVGDEILTFLLAGHETTANALTWFMYETCRNPGVMTLLQEEVASITNIEPTADDLTTLKYMTMCMKEILRLYPPASEFSRRAPKDFTLGGVHIPEDTTIQFTTYAIHHDPLLWDDPESFDPERFGDNGKPYDTFSYIPFSLGERNCIGQNFFWLEIKVFLLYMIRSFEWFLSPNQTIRATSGAGTFKPKDPIRFVLHKR